MTKEQFDWLEARMLASMEEGAHGAEHVYRVLYIAMDIAAAESGVDYDVLIAACLLHDICRVDQGAGRVACHAAAGAEKAAELLLRQGWSEAFAHRVAHCIRSHRFRSAGQPESIEAKILFDADKVDVTGAMGVARTLQYGGEMGEALYTLDEAGLPSDGVGDERPSFFQEYKFKLERLYDRFYTARGRELALGREQAAAAFYQALLAETRQAYAGRQQLRRCLEGEL